MSNRKQMSSPESEENHATLATPDEIEKHFVDRNRNGLDASKLNVGIKAIMARELHYMGLEDEAISRILRAGASKVAEWIRLDMEKEGVDD